MLLVSTMAINKLQELVKYQQKIAALQKELGKQQRKLLALPGKLGYKSVGELIGALQAAGGGGKAAAPAGARRPRAKITPDTKAKVKSMVAAEKTGAEIAAALGISLPSVQNIKKELGLVKKRG